MPPRGAAGRRGRPDSAGEAEYAQVSGGICLVGFWRLLCRIQDARKQPLLCRKPRARRGGFRERASSWSRVYFFAVK